MNTTKQVGGALGLAVLITYAAASGSDKADLLDAYNRAFYAIAAIMIVTAAVALTLPAHRDHAD